MHLDSFGFEELTQLLDLLLELSNEFRVGVLINNRLAHNLLRAVSVSLMSGRRGNLITQLLLKIGQIHCHWKGKEEHNKPIKNSCIPQGAERLVVVDIGRGDGRNHGGFGIATQILAEQPSQR